MAADISLREADWQSTALILIESGATPRESALTPLAGAIS